MAKRMNPAIRSEWIMALTEPHMRHKKGSVYLNKDGCMCAFGVLCDLYRRAHPDNDQAQWQRFRDGVMGFGESSRITDVPSFVLEWAGIDSGQRNTWSHPVNQVMARNDGTNGHSVHDFPRLAQYIEAYV